MKNKTFLRDIIIVLAFLVLFTIGPKLFQANLVENFFGQFINQSKIVTDDDAVPCDACNVEGECEPDENGKILCNQCDKTCENECYECEQGLNLDTSEMTDSEIDELTASFDDYNWLLPDNNGSVSSSKSFVTYIILSEDNENSGGSRCPDQVFTSKSGSSGHTMHFSNPNKNFQLDMVIWTNSSVITSISPNNFSIDPLNKETVTYRFNATKDETITVYKKQRWKNIITGNYQKYDKVSGTMVDVSADDAWTQCSFRIKIDVKDPNEKFEALAKKCRYCCSVTDRSQIACKESEDTCKQYMNKVDLYKNESTSLHNCQTPNFNVKNSPKACRYGWMLEYLWCKTSIEYLYSSDRGGYGNELSTPGKFMIDVHVSYGQGNNRTEYDFDDGEDQPPSKVEMFFFGSPEKGKINSIEESIMPHEVLHILFYTFIPPAKSKNSLWLNEGMAASMEEDAAKCNLRHRKLIEGLQKGLSFPINNLLTVSTGDDVYGVVSDLSEAHTFYSQSWSMTEYLLYLGYKEARDAGNDVGESVCKSQRKLFKMARNTYKDNINTYLEDNLKQYEISSINDLRIKWLADLNKKLKTGCYGTPYSEDNISSPSPDDRPQSLKNLDRIYKEDELQTLKKNIGNNDYIVLKIGMEFCPPCRLFDSHHNFIQSSLKNGIIYVDTFSDNTSNYSEKFDRQSELLLLGRVPRFLVFDKQGRCLGLIMGYKDPNTFLGELRNIISNL